MNISLPRKAQAVCLLFAIIHLIFILSACLSKNDPNESVEVPQGTEQLEKTSSRKAMAIRASSGSKKLDIATERMRQAMGYFSQKDLGKAEPLLIESLKLYENAFGGDDISIEELKTDIKNQIVKEYMEVHRYLYILYSETGRHNKAEESVNKGIMSLAEKFSASDQTISIFIKSIENFKNQHAERTYVKQQVESQHNNHHVKSKFELASQNRIVGNNHFFNKEYAKAEHYFQLVLDYCETNSHNSPELCCKAMNDMGALKSGIVFSDEGLSYFKSALLLAENSFPPDNSIIVETLINIGHYYSSIIDCKNASKYYERALDILKNKFGEDHPLFLKISFSLGRLYFLENDFDKASECFNKAMVGIEKTLGNNCDLYAQCIYHLGFINHTKRKYDEAEKLYIQAINIWKNELGQTSYPQVLSYNFLARIYADRGDFDKVINSLLECHHLEDKAVDQITGFTSEGQQLDRAMDDLSILQKYLYFIGRYYKQDQEKIKEAFNIWLKGKGRILDVQARLHESNLANENPELSKLFKELKVVRSKISKLSFSQPGTVDRVAYKREKDRLEGKKDQLEAQLSRASKPFAAKRRVAQADNQQVANTLPAGTVLLEFARTQATIDNPAGQSVNSYIAFILNADAGGNIGIVELGDADQIDSIIARYKKALSASGKGNGHTASATSRELYDLIFRPLLKNIGTAKSVYVSPDGNLSLLPFEVLQRPDGRFLIEDYTFNYLSAGRDLVGFANYDISDGKCLLMGAPDFEIDQPGQSKRNRKIMANRSADLGGLSFVPLHHAKAELDAIGKVIGPGRSEIYVGGDAMENTLLDADHPYFIHLATHGFFLSDQVLPGTGRGFQMAALPTAGGQSQSQVKGKVDIENPLLRSGILLAGAKRSLTEGSNGYFDGIVTAEEILGMNLHGTEMVVLSACDTGLGEVKSGEGVFGLRRAFTQAGAKSIVMSLWKVPDRETKELMVQFYRNIKSGSMNRCQALRQAILKEKEIVRKRYGHDNPRYWGAFVFMGQP